MHYFSTAGIKHYDQGDKEKGEFIRARDSRGIRSRHSRCHGNRWMAR